MTATLNFFNPKIFLVFMILCLIAAGMYLFADASHAWFTHGADADRAENCLKQNGFQRIYRALNEKNWMTFHFLCTDSSGDWFDYIVRDNGDTMTFFGPKGGVLDEIVKWIFRKPAAKMIDVKAVPEVVMNTLKTLGVPLH